MKILHATITKYILLIFLLIVFLASCKKVPPEVKTIHELPKGIVSITFVKYDSLLIDSEHVVVNYSGDSVNVLVPPGTSLAHLTPVIKYQGQSILPASGVPQDFSSPIQYTVTASDGTTRTFTIIVSWSNADGIVYMGTSDKTFYAIDAVSGGFYWKYTAPDGNFSYSGPSTANGIVYAGSTDGNLYAFDAATGEIVWKFAAGEAIESGPAVKNGIVYFGSDDDYFYAVDALSGALKWKYQTGHNVSSVPVVVNDIVYVGSDDANLYAFDAATGDIQWTYAAGSIFNASSPVYDNGTIFIGSRDGNLHAVDAATGNVKWKYFNGGISLEQSRPYVYNNVVYIGGWYSIDNFNAKGSVYAVDEATGNSINTYLDSLAFSSSPFVQNNNLYIAADDLNFYCVNTSTGAVNWKANIIPNGASPLVVNNVVYIGGGGSGFIYAFDAATGAEKWRLPTGNGSSTSTPCFFAADGTIYHTNIAE